MNPPFAMLALEAFEQPIAGSVSWLSGPAIGRVPEPGDPLRVYSPFSSPLRIRMRALGGRPRGSTKAVMVIGVDEIPSIRVEQLRGALICEEGVDVRTFTARTRRTDAVAAAARFRLGEDQAWGLVRMMHGIVNLAVVGGGLGTHDFWQDLELLRVEGWPEPLRSTDLEPVTTAETDLLWQLPQLTSYPQSAARNALVLRPMGPVRVRHVDVWLGDRWENAGVFQSEKGPAQVLVSNDRTPSVLAAPVPVAA